MASTEHRKLEKGVVRYGPDVEDVSGQPEIADEHRNRVFTMSAEVETVEQDGLLKVGRFRHFEFFSDEPPVIGGGDRHPQPLTYLAASVGFCLLTQIERIARAKKRTITRATCRCEFDTGQEGSILAGTLTGRCWEFRLDVDVESPEPREAVAEILRLADQSCPAEALVRAPVPVISRFVVNGDPLEVE